MVHIVHTVHLTHLCAHCAHHAPLYHMWQKCAQMYTLKYNHVHIEHSVHTVHFLHLCAYCALGAPDFWLSFAVYTRVHPKIQLCAHLCAPFIVVFGTMCTLSYWWCRSHTQMNYRYSFIAPRFSVLALYADSTPCECCLWDHRWPLCTLCTLLTPISNCAQSTQKCKPQFADVTWSPAFPQRKNYRKSF